MNTETKTHRKRIAVRWTWLLWLAAALAMPVGARAIDFSATTREGHMLFFDSLIPGNYGYVAGLPRVSVTRCNSGASGKLTIDPYVECNGRFYEVYAIGARAFYNQTELTEVVLPRTVEVIEDFAFTYCCGISNLVVPGNVWRVGTEAFFQITHVQMAFGGGNTFGAYSKNSVYRDSLWYSDETFTRVVGAHRQLVNGYVPETVINIGNNAFAYCQKLETISLPNRLQQISEMAFYECRALTNINVPSSVSYIGEQAFRNVMHVQYPNVGNRWSTDPNYGQTQGGEVCSNGVLIDSLYYPDTIRYRIMGAHRRLVHAIMPSAVNIVQAKAFSYCKHMKEVDFSNHLYNIGNSAFIECVQLRNVYLHDGVNRIEGNAFYQCKRLKSVHFGMGTLQIYSGTFLGCDSITDIYIGANIHRDSRPDLSVADETTITLGPNVISVPDYAIVNRNYSTGVRRVVAEGQNCPIWPSFRNVVRRPYDITLVAPCSVARLFMIDTFMNMINHYEMTDADYRVDITFPNTEGRVFCNYDCATQTATLSVGTYSGYRFRGWSDGVTDNPRQVHVTSDTHWHAIFYPVPYTLSVRSWDTNMGTTEGSGVYTYGSHAIIRAIPKEGFCLDIWSDGDTRTTRYVTVTGNRTYYALFRPMPRITVRSADTNMGTCTGSGQYGVNEEAIIEAFPKPGYRFRSWNDGNTRQRRIVGVSADSTFIAFFGPGLQLTVNSSDTSKGVCSGSGYYNQGDVVTIHADAKPGYRFAFWQDGSDEEPRTITMTCDSTFTAYFKTDDALAVPTVDPWQDITIQIQGRQLQIDGCRGDHIFIFDLLGRRLVSRRADDETAVVSLPQPGVYLLVVGQRPAKKIVAF